MPGKKSEFVIVRSFNAPRELVWKAWTEPTRIKEWWGPKGSKVLSAKMDLRPGGTYHYGMRSPDGMDMWGKAVYREVVKPEKLVFVNSFSDKNGGVTRHPLSPNWPLELLSTITFEEVKGKTQVTVRWMPLNPTETERATFDQGHESMTQGWSGSFDQLDAYLKKHAL